MNKKDCHCEVINTCVGGCGNLILSSNRYFVLFDDLHLGEVRHKGLSADLVKGDLQHRIAAHRSRRQDHPRAESLMIDGVADLVVIGSRLGSRLLRKGIEFLLRLIFILMIRKNILVAGFF